MDTYSFLRGLADSWFLLAMFAFYIAVGVLAFLPSQSKARYDASMIPFRNDFAEQPASDTTPDTGTGTGTITDKAPDPTRTSKGPTHG